MPVAFRSPARGHRAALFAAVVSVAAPLSVLAAASPAEIASAFAPQGVVSLSSSASIEVTKDLLSITFSTTREGLDAASVQAQLKQALDAALAEAKKAARPGQLDVQTGNFSLSPRYTNKGIVSGWQGSTELIVEGRDMQAIGQLSGRITTLTINRVGYGMSRELREKSEGEVTVQAIARYRAKAADCARQFGYAGYAIREVNVASNEQSPMPRPMLMQARAAAAPAPEDALAVEPGKGTVTVSVNGTVQMTK
ncbi:MAG TPA: SIMPL domain-containing protein [Burkholderiaceae bacterium]|nr:SIMPL domain-containing protein [Burkholderiaceae bacterium]